MLDNTTTQPFKNKGKNCIEKNDNAQGTYSTNSQIKLKNMLKSSLSNCSNAYIVGAGVEANAAGANAATRLADERCTIY